MNKVTKLCFGLFFVGLTISCDVSYLEKEIDDISWNGTVKIPAGFASYNLSELFNDLGSSTLEPTSTEEFSFKFTETFSGENNDTFNVAMDDTSIESSIESPITENDLSAIEESFPYTITAEITPGVANPLIKTYSIVNQKIHDLALTQEIAGIEFNKGTMSFTFKSTVDANMEVTVTIPSFTKKSDGSIYTRTISIIGRADKTISLDLSNYNGDFSNDGTGTGKTTNKIVVDVDASFTFAAGDTLTATDAISYEAKITNITYDVIYGDFKQESFNFSNSTLNLGDLFDNFSEENLAFENATMSINVSNDYGFPVSMDLSSVKAVNANSSLNLSYTNNSSLANTIIIDGVANFGDNAKDTNHIFDDSNSNIGALLESRPTFLEFNISGKANPIDDGNPNENFYAAINDGFTADISIGFDKVSLDQEIDFSEGEDLSDFNYIKLIVNVENKIPLTGDILLEFKNSSGQVVHTESINAFQAANINAARESDGVAILSSFEIELNQNEINDIIDTDKINVRVTLQLPTASDSVIIKGSDELNVAVAIEANVDITSGN